MVLEYDEKGKLFTDVIAKDKILCRIFTATNQIRGFVHVRKNERLSDEINQPESFLAVTDAEIYNQEGSILYTNKFIVINRAHIIWLMPIEEPQSKTE